MPIIPDEQQQFMDGYFSLSTSRDMNGNIPVSEIQAYLETINVTTIEERLEWMHLIQAMDAEMRDWQESKDKPDG
jgi:hypothetical protein